MYIVKNLLIPGYVLWFLILGYATASEYCNQNTHDVTANFETHLNSTSFYCQFDMPATLNKAELLVDCPENTEFIHGGYSISEPSQISIAGSYLDQLNNSSHRHKVTFARTLSSGGVSKIGVSATCSGLYSEPVEPPLTSKLKCELDISGEFIAQYNEIPKGVKINHKVNFHIDNDNPFGNQPQSAAYKEIEGAQGEIKVSIEGYTSIPQDGGEPETVSPASYSLPFEFIQISPQVERISIRPKGLLMAEIGGVDQSTRATTLGTFIFIDDQLHNNNKVPSDALVWNSGNYGAVKRGNLMLVSPSDPTKPFGLFRFDEVIASCSFEDL